MSSFLPDFLFSFWVNCLFVLLTLWINVGGKWQVLLMCFPVYLVMDPSDIVFLSLMFSYHHFQRYCMNILVWFFSHFFVFSRIFDIFCCYSIFPIGTFMIHPRSCNLCRCFIPIQLKLVITYHWNTVIFIVADVICLSNTNCCPVI